MGTGQVYSWQQVLLGWDSAALVAHKGLLLIGKDRVSLDNLNQQNGFNNFLITH